MVAQLQFRLHRRLLEVAELREEQGTGNQTADGLFYNGGGGDVAAFDINMVIVLAALLCALICVVGINSIIRCAVRCGYMFAIFEASSSPYNNNGHDHDHDHYHNHQHVLVTISLELANTGLKKSTLNQIPVVAYGSPSGVMNVNSAATDCPICLGEFEQGEKVRILPECKHGFHVQCIDTWFVSHTSCPLCRQLPYIHHQQEE